VKPEEPGPVKLIVGVLYSDEGLLEKGLSLLTERYGGLDYRSPVFPFDRTDYYVPEMGCPIFRIFVSHERLIHPRDLSRIKVETNAMEEKLAVSERSGGFETAPVPEPSSDLPQRTAILPEVVPCRKVNFDPGYMDYDKFVLASAKYNGQKIYLDHGIWADLTLHYEKGRFDPYPWSFPDFKAGLYDAVFLEIRGRFKEQRKAQLSV
jgi:hypothetical protein